MSAVDHLPQNPRSVMINVIVVAKIQTDYLDAVVKKGCYVRSELLV